MCANKLSILNKIICVGWKYLKLFNCWQTMTTNVVLVVIVCQQLNKKNRITLPTKYSLK